MTLQSCGLLSDGHMHMDAKFFSMSRNCPSIELREITFIIYTKFDNLLNVRISACHEPWQWRRVSVLSLGPEANLFQVASFTLS